MQMRSELASELAVLDCRLEGHYAWEQTEPKSEFPSSGLVSAFSLDVFQGPG